MIYDFDLDKWLKPIEKDPHFYLDRESQGAINARSFLYNNAKEILELAKDGLKWREQDKSVSDRIRQAEIDIDSGDIPQ